MIYNVYHHDVEREHAYIQAKAKLEFHYDDGKSHLEALSRQNQIHLNNLTYLEQVASKYGLDVPLKIVNELQAEREQLRQVQIEIEWLEKRLDREDTSRELDRQEYDAAEAQRRSKLIQAETYQKNIFYLEEMAGRQKREIPLSLHNAFREEIQRLITVRQCIAKIDKQMQILASALDKGGDFPQLGYRREDHRHLINQVRAAQKFQPNTLKIVGMVSVERNVFCVVSWGNKICVLDSSSLATERRLFDVLRAYVENVSGEKPRLLLLPYNLELFYERVGQVVLTNDLQYAEEIDTFIYRSMTPSYQAGLHYPSRFDFDFHLAKDVVYINTDQGIVEGGRSLWWWKIQEARRRRTKQ